MAAVTEDPYMILRELNNRVRILEERYSRIRERMFIINQNMVDEYKKVSSEINAFNKDLKEIKTNLFTIKETMSHLIKELDLFARKDHLKILEKYINLWNPFNFVTEVNIFF
jgi:hypothetical protein